MDAFDPGRNAQNAARQSVDITRCEAFECQMRAVDLRRKARALVSEAQKIRERRIEIRAAVDERRAVAPAPPPPFELAPEPTEESLATFVALRIQIAELLEKQEIATSERERIEIAHQRTIAEIEADALGRRLFSCGDLD